MIKVLGGQKNPHDTWKRLAGTYPEVLGKCENLKFPGPGQRDTPVAKDKEAAFYILGGGQGIGGCRTSRQPQLGELEVLTFWEDLRASVDPELHAAATAAIQVSGLGVSAWLAEAIALKFDVEERCRYRP